VGHPRSWLPAVFVPIEKSPRPVNGTWVTVNPATPVLVNRMRCSLLRRYGGGNTTSVVEGVRMPPVEAVSSRSSRVSEVLTVTVSVRVM